MDKIIEKKYKINNVYLQHYFNLLVDSSYENKAKRHKFLVEKIIELNLIDKYFTEIFQILDYNFNDRSSGNFFNDLESYKYHCLFLKEIEKIYKNLDIELKENKFLEMKFLPRQVKSKILQSLLKTTQEKEVLNFVLEKEFGDFFEKGLNLEHYIKIKIFFNQIYHCANNDNKDYIINYIMKKYKPEDLGIDIVSSKNVLNLNLNEDCSKICHWLKSTVVNDNFFNTFVLNQFVIKNSVNNIIKKKNQTFNLKMIYRNCKILKNMPYKDFLILSKNLCVQNKIETKEIEQEIIIEERKILQLNVKSKQVNKIKFKI